MTRFTDWLMSDHHGHMALTLACCFFIGLTMGGLFA